MPQKFDWYVACYDDHDEVCSCWEIYGRTEREATREAEADVAKVVGVNDWTISKLLPIYGIRDVVEQWKEFAQRYAWAQTNDDHVPSAPDTSKFFAVKKGNIEIRTNCDVGVFPLRRTYPYVFIVGTAIESKIREKLLKTAQSIARSCGYSTYRIDGTAWSGICLSHKGQ